MLDYDAWRNGPRTAPAGRLRPRGVANCRSAEGGRARTLVACFLLFVALAALVVIGSRKVGFYQVPTSSMEPTLQPNDRLLTYSSESYERGEVVVIHDPDEPGGYLVKRIVGLAGDRVRVRNGHLIVNGSVVEEPYLKEKIRYMLPVVQVHRDEVFLLGDNRNRSRDGHIWKHGVPANTIVGAVRTIYAPGSRMGARVAYTHVFLNVSPRRVLEARVTGDRARREP